MLLIYESISRHVEYFTACTLPYLPYLWTNAEERVDRSCILAGLASHTSKGGMCCLHMVSTSKFA